MPASAYADTPGSAGGPPVEDGSLPIHSKPPGLELHLAPSPVQVAIKHILSYERMHMNTDESKSNDFIEHVSSIANDVDLHLDPNHNHIDMQTSIGDTATTLHAATQPLHLAGKVAKSSVTVDALELQANSAGASETVGGAAHASTGRQR